MCLNRQIEIAMVGWSEAGIIDELSKVKGVKSCRVRFDKEDPFKVNVLIGVSLPMFLAPRWLIFKNRFINRVCNLLWWLLPAHIQAVGGQKSERRNCRFDICWHRTMKQNGDA